MKNAIENGSLLVRQENDEIALFPLIYSNEVLGMFALHAKEFDEFKTLWRIAENVSYAISSLRARMAKIKTEEMYKTIVENTGTAIVVINNSRKIIFANQEVEKQFGFKKEFLQGRDFSELLPEDVKRDVLEWYERMDIKSFPKTYETTIFDAEGRRKNVVLTITLLPDGDKHILASIVDITKLNEEKRKREEAETLYRSIFESSKDGIVITDFRGKIVECNNAALKIVGMNREEVVGRNFIELGIFYEEDIPKLLQKFIGGLLEERVDTQEVRIRTKDGTKWIDVTPIILRKEGRVFGYLSIIRDTTEKRRYMRSLSRAVKKLGLLHEIDAKISAKEKLDEIVSFAANEMARMTGADTVVFSMPERELEKVSACKDVEPDIIREFCRKVDIQNIREVIRVDDVSTLRRVEHDILVRAGFKSYVISPLVVDGRVTGAIFLFPKDAEAFREKDEFIREISYQLALSLHLHHLGEIRDEARKQIDHNIEQFAILVDHIRTHWLLRGDI